MYKKIVDGKFTFTSATPPDAQDLIRRFLVADPEKRLGSESMGGGREILQSAFLQGIDTVKLAMREIKAPYLPYVESPTDMRHCAYDGDEKVAVASKPPPELSAAERDTMRKTWGGFRDLGAPWPGKTPPGHEASDSGSDSDA